MDDSPQAQFNGWAKVEVMGHQSHIGFVKTEAYGAAVLFRIDTPELPEREYELPEPAYVAGRYCPAGTRVKRPASPGLSVLVGAGSIYRIIPCSEAAAMRAIESSVRSELCVLELPAAAAAGLETPESDDSTEFFDDDDDESGGRGEGDPSIYTPAAAELKPSY